MAFGSRRTVCCGAAAFPFQALPLLAAYPVQRQLGSSVFRLGLPQRRVARVARFCGRGLAGRAQTALAALAGEGGAPRPFAELRACGPRAAAPALAAPLRWGLREKTPAFLRVGALVRWQVGRLAPLSKDQAKRS